MIAKLRNLLRLLVWHLRSAISSVGQTIELASHAF